jgi:hypothetical protein
VVPTLLLKVRLAATGVAGIWVGSSVSYTTMIDRGSAVNELSVGTKAGTVSVETCPGGDSVETCRMRNDPETNLGRSAFPSPSKFVGEPVRRPVESPPAYRRVPPGHRVNATASVAPALNAR